MGGQADILGVEVREEGCVEGGEKGACCRREDDLEMVEGQQRRSGEC